MDGLATVTGHHLGESNTWQGRLGLGEGEVDPRRGSPSPGRGRLGLAYGK